MRQRLFWATQLQVASSATDSWSMFTFVLLSLRLNYKTSLPKEGERVFTHIRHKNVHSLYCWFWETRARQRQPCVCLCLNAPLCQYERLDCPPLLPSPLRRQAKNQGVRTQRQHPTLKCTCPHSKNDTYVLGNPSRFWGSYFLPKGQLMRCQSIYQ